MNGYGLSVVPLSLIVVMQKIRPYFSLFLKKIKKYAPIFPYFSKKSRDYLMSTCTMRRVTHRDHNANRRNRYFLRIFCLGKMKKIFNWTICLFFLDLDAHEIAALTRLNGNTVRTAAAADPETDRRVL